MNKLKICLIEDDPIICEATKKYITSSNDFCLVSITDNSEQAFKDIIHYNPDAIILDLELNETGAGGLRVLHTIKEQNLHPIPFIVVVTNNLSDTIRANAHNNGADFFLSKSATDYSPEKVIDFLKEMKSSIQAKRSLPSSISATTESLQQQQQRITRNIIDELNKIGINPKSKGYQYLIDAIHLVIQEPQTRLCATIGKKYKKTEGSIERAMQRAIDRAWLTNDVDDLLKHFTAKINSERDVPTVTEFVYYYATMIRNEY